VYDSVKSSKSSTRELFIQKLKANSVVVEKGVLNKPASGFVAFEHLVYADKGISALTITAQEKIPTHVYSKYSVFDRDFDVNSLLPNLGSLAEALAETLVIQTYL